MTKQRLKRLSQVLGIIALVYVGIALSVESVPLFGRYHHFVIVSDSMEPTIDVHDVVIIDESKSYQAGDIIAFETTINDQSVRVVHYVDEIVSTGNGDEIYTRSENGAQDDWVLSHDDVIGTYVNSVPRIGVFLNFLSSTIGRIVLLINIIGIVVIVKLLKAPQQKTDRTHPQR